ncbi:hypothetical protein AB7M29_001641 [Pseudomonas sp. F-14 TE3623]
MELSNWVEMRGSADVADNVRGALDTIDSKRGVRFGIFWQTRESIRNQSLVNIIHSSSEIGWRNPIKLPSTPVLIGGR